MAQGSTNRKKGHNAERLYSNLFIKLGFSHCVTARYGSRQHDDAGIDLINLPFNVQIKAGKQKGLNPSGLLSEIKERISKMFPKQAPEHEQPLIIIHRKEVGRGRKRDEFSDIVHMSFEDFTKIINMIKWE